MPGPCNSGSTRSIWLRFAAFSSLVVGLIGVGQVHGAGPVAPSRPASEPSQRPHVLWISLEDISPDLGCYGDPYAITPLFDQLARRGVRYTQASAHAPVCAPARHGIITGRFPTSNGGHQMRCQSIPPASVRCLSEHLRAQGYFTTNHSKTDYQFQPPVTAWDQNSNQAHWRGRREGQPFFAVFNFTNTHESQARNPSEETQRLVAALPTDKRHDPAKAILPPYYPDTPVVRRNWANYYDTITAVEAKIQAILDELEADGLTEETIIWIWSDHGRGLPRGKRWLYDSGLRVPLIVIVPEKWRTYAFGARAAQLAPGTTCDDLVSFLDFAPTMVSLCGGPMPESFQGRAFLGPQATTPPRAFIYAARDRMDERLDMSRAVSDGRYKYIRNFLPDVPQGQILGYMELMPIMREWRRLGAQGGLNPVQATFLTAPKPVEELYDTQTDPHEIRNLAADPAQRQRRERMRAELRRWMLETRDLGIIPEPILNARQRPGDQIEPTRPPQLISIIKQEDVNAGKHRLTYGLASPTEGGSIAYRVVETVGHAEAPKSDDWSLAVRDPNPIVTFHGEHVFLHRATVEPGQTIEAKAIRIGFTESPVVRFEPDSDLATQTPILHPDRRGADVVTANDDFEGWLDLLDRLTLAPPEEARAARVEALESADPVRRWWAARAERFEPIDEACAEALIARTRPLIARLEHEQDLAVRIQLAWSLGRLSAALPEDGPECRSLERRCFEELKAILDDPEALASHKHHVLLAFDDLGELARPLIGRLETISREGTEYPKRVAQSLLTRLTGATFPD